MNARTFLILAGIFFIGLVTKNIFWTIIAALIFFFYALSLGGHAVRKGASKTKTRIKQSFNAEMGELEKTTGKFPGTFFEDAGKAIVEKMGEDMVPPGAKSYREASNYRWAIKEPAVKLPAAVGKFLDGLFKLFGK